MKRNDEMKSVHVELPKDLHRRVKVMAAVRDTSIGAEARVALESRVEQFEREGAAV